MSATQPYSVGLAPMEGVTGLPFRAWLWLVSAPSAMSTPFLRVTPTYPTRELPEDFAPELFALKSYTPYHLIPQLMATDAAQVERVASYLRTQTDFVELNCGCPSPTPVGKGAGSSLLRDPLQFHKMADELATAMGPQHFAIKMRTGFEAASELGELVRGIAELPLARLTIHGRTRVDSYRGHARWDLIEDSARRTSTPVIASGDILDFASLRRLKDAAPHVAGAIIGRGVLRNPWIFEELRRKAPVWISSDTLLYVVASSALIHALHFRGALVGLIQEGLLETTLGDDAEAWRRMFERLSLATFGRVMRFDSEDDTSLNVERVILGRTKMIWNYFRSSLPPVFFAPTLLRSQTLGSLLHGISELCRQHESEQRHGRGGLTLTHRQEYDWIYAGEKRPEELRLYTERL